ncbi:MAG: hypothetical protein H6Q86_3219 [candidate division NC10 bacterium]|nr:hypothetical protein [candidate division NC10 bacterium]
MNEPIDGPRRVQDGGRQVHREGRVLVPPGIPPAGTDEAHHRMKDVEGRIPAAVTSFLPTASRPSARRRLAPSGRRGISFLHKRAC